MISGFMLRRVPDNFFPPSCNKSLITWLSGFAGPLLAFVSIPVHLPLNERGAVQPKAELQVE